MEVINRNDIRIQYPGFYNVYPIENEISLGGAVAIDTESYEDDLMLDDYYGRVFSLGLYNNVVPYGNDNRNYYPTGINDEIIETLRVPYRKIPIYGGFQNLSKISLLIEDIKKVNPSYEILLRGQSKIYNIDRSNEEKIKLYGSSEIREPSFLPSHLRNSFDETFMHCMWHSQASYLLNDIGADLTESLSAEALRQYTKDVYSIRGGVRLTPFSLGIAQHYGMPSVGLDLTKKINVAAWFATHRIQIDDTGSANSSPIDDFTSSTIFVFRCPENAVFPYSDVRPVFFPEGRPDRQDAWFGHVGWGAAKNQLASYLICGFRLDKKVLNEFEKNYERTLFPSIEEDPILAHFMAMKNKRPFQGEAKRALDKIYFMKE